MHSLKRNILSPSSLIWRRRTIRRGNMELWMTSTTLVWEVTYQVLFLTFSLTDSSRLELVPPFPIVMIRKWGVPQGSILSVTLLNIKINNIVKCLGPNVDCSLYVDDFLICYRSKNMQSIERQPQLNLNKVQSWATENGFKFSESKTACMHFCRKRGNHSDPQLRLGKTAIPVVDEYKFLGLVFDRKLTFIPHIKQLKAKCQKALDLLRVGCR